MSTWVQQVQGDNVDLETIVANKNTIKVNNVDDGAGSGDNKIALYAKNGSVAANARALKVEGKAEVANLNADAVALLSTNTHTGTGARSLYTEGQVEMVAGLTGNPAITAVKVYNPSTNSTARALAVTGDGGKSATISNTVDDVTLLALEVNGNSKLQRLAGLNLAHKTLEVVNASNHADARAIKVSGEVEIDAFATGDPASIGLHVKNASTHASALSLKAENKSIIGGVTLNGGKVTASQMLCNADAYVNGLLTAHGQIEGDGNSVIIGADSQISSGVEIGAQDVPTSIKGNLTLGSGAAVPEMIVTAVGQDADLRIVADRLIVGPAPDSACFIDTVSGGDGQSSLYIGTRQGFENSITLGQPNAPLLIASQTTAGAMTVTGELIVGPGNDQGLIDANGDLLDPRQLSIGTQGETGTITIGRAAAGLTVEVNSPILDANGELRVGPQANPGLIDAGGPDLPGAQVLMIGTQDFTLDVQIGRGGRNVAVNAAILDANGELRVGPAGAAGLIDSGGNGVARDLKIATQNVSSDLYLGRSGKDVIAQDDLQVKGTLTVGPTASAGKIDSGGTTGTPKELDLGTQTVTSDVRISRSNKTTYVDGGLGVAQNASISGALSVTGNATLQGTLAVGPYTGAAALDANGSPTAQNLAIGGGNGSADVLLSRNGQRVDVQADSRFNSHEVVLNGAANLANAASAGYVVNANGHGNGKSIDFWIDGAMRGYIDVTGWH